MNIVHYLLLKLDSDKKLHNISSESYRNNKVNKLYNKQIYD